MKQKRSNKTIILILLVILTTTQKGFAQNVNDKSIEMKGVPYKFDELYKNSKNITKLGDYIDTYNLEYEYIINENVKGYEKATREMKKVEIGSIFKEFMEKACFPVSKEYFQISSEFGIRKDSFNNAQVQNNNINSLPFHTGLDISAPGIEGTNVYSMLDGVIKKISMSNSGYGNLIIIDSGDVELYYAHLNSISEGLIEGDHVISGDVIGTVGSTGRSTGPHLHLEVVKDNIALNPKLFIPKKENLEDKLNNNDGKTLEKSNDVDYKNENINQNIIKNFIFD